MWSHEEIFKYAEEVNCDAKPLNIDLTSLFQVRRFGESGDRESLMKLSRENQMHDFWAHSSHMCEVCSGE